MMDPIATMWLQDDRTFGHSGGSKATDRIQKSI